LATQKKISSKGLPGKNSGRSKDSSNSKGKRRIKEGKELAPKSLRRKGKVFINECSQAELEKAEVI
jgi:hypothetical protein